MRNQNTNFMEAFKQSYQNMIAEEDMAPLGSFQKSESGGELYPPAPLVSYQNFSKFELDTLFAIFYFSQDKNQRFLASKELKAR